MKYSPDFWIAVASATPVVVLANVVYITVSTRSDYTQLTRAAQRFVRRANFIRVIVSAVNMFALSQIFYAAIRSLEDGQNFMSPNLAAGLASLGLAVVPAVALLQSLANYKPENDPYNIPDSETPPSKDSGEPDQA